MSRMLFAVIITTLFCALAWVPNGEADTSWSQPVRRQTNSRIADLIAALIDHDRLDEAAKICAQELKSASPQSDAAAWWAIRSSEILTRRQLTGDTFDAAAIEAAQRPVTDLLASYPNHARALFLNVQKLAVEREAARHSVVIASVTPTTQQAQDQIFTDLVRVTSQLTELGTVIDAQRATVDSAAKSATDRVLSADLLRLHQEVLIDVVSMALLQTELFRPGGRDYIASSNKGERAAEKALLQLPSDSPARIEIERLRVQAILQSGQYDRAETDLHQLIRLVGPPLPPSIQALRLKLATARSRLPEASQRVQEFYGSELSTAPKSVEMDLARLEFLLSSPDPKVGDWIDQIEARNGAFARRRAEAIALARMKSTDKGYAGDASMIAAQGQDWLRRGDPKRASEFLVAAAKAEQQADRAITRATEAAAALIAANRRNDAATILSETSLAHPTGKNAAQALLQSAHLHAEEKADDVALRVETVLRHVINQWPESPQSDQARTWLIKLLHNQNELVQAAQIATNLSSSRATDANIRVAAELWKQAARQQEHHQVTGFGRLFRTSFTPLLPAASSVYRAAAAFVLDEESLALLDDIPTSTAETFPEKLLAFRRTTSIQQLESPPPELFEDTTWRLMRDGRRNSLLRKRNATVIRSWQSDEQPPTLEQLERTIWLGNAQSAIKLVDSMASKSAEPGKVISDAARLLAASGQRDAKLAAIKLWDQFAAGISKGTPTWHDAKLAAIKLLVATRSGDQAAKRAKFILLTSPPQDASLRGQYESIITQNQ